MIRRLVAAIAFASIFAAPIYAQTSTAYQLETTTIGPAFSGNGTPVSSSTRTYWAGTALPFDAQITKINVEVTATGVMPWRWSSYSTPGTSYELGVSAVRDAYDEAGVKVIATDGVDFVSEYGGDGHPPPTGHAHVTTIIAEGLAK